MNTYISVQHLLATWPGFVISDLSSFVQLQVSFIAIHFSCKFPINTSAKLPASRRQVNSSWCVQRSSLLVTADPRTHWGLAVVTWSVVTHSLGRLPAQARARGPGGRGSRTCLPGLPESPSRAVTFQKYPCFNRAVINFGALGWNVYKTFVLGYLIPLRCGSAVRASLCRRSEWNNTTRGSLTWQGLVQTMQPFVESSFPLFKRCQGGCYGNSSPYLSRLEEVNGFSVKCTA